MPTVDAHSFLDGLDALLVELKALDPHPSAHATQALYQKYRKLHRQARTLPLKGVLRQASADQKLMVRFLELGKENYDSFMRDLVVHIQPSAQDTAVAVADFLKSPAAFRHLRARLQSEDSPSLSAEELEQEGLDREAVRRIVGSMLGVEVSEKFVLSIRGEMAGKLVTYSLSGLCEDDLKAWDNPAVRKQWDSRDDYLLDCIRRHDTVLAYEMGEHDPQTSTYPIACVLFPETEEGRRRPSHQADSCMVNHRTKVIVFGAQTTSNEHDAGQAMSAVRMFSALQQLVKQPTLGEDGVPNPHYGYSVIPSFLHAGYFPADRTEGKRATGQAFLDTLEAAGERLNDEDRQALARQAFFNVFSEENPNPSLAAVWAQFNVQVCGADTLQLFHDMRSALEAQYPQRRFSEIVLDGTVEALEVLAREGVFVSSKSRGQNVMKPILDGILNTLDNHPINFPCLPDERNKLVKLSGAERTLLSHAASYLDRLRAKIQADNPGDHQRMCRHMARLSESIRKGTYQEEFLAEENRTGPQYAWSSALHARLDGRHEKLIDDGEAYIQAIWSGMARDISEHRVPGVLLAARTVAEQDMGNQEEFKQGLFEEAFGYIEKSRKLRPLDRAKNLRAYNDFHSSFRRMETVSAGSLLAKGLRGLYRKGAFLAVRQGRTDQNGATELRELVYVLLDMCQKPGAGALRQALHATARQELPGVLQSVARPTRKPRV